MSPFTESSKLPHSASCMASVVVEADGSLRLDGQRDVLARDIVARNEVLSNIAATADVGEEVCLPITRTMASAWLKGVAFAEGGQALHQLGESSRTLSQTLLAADAMADMDTVNKLCRSQRTRIRVVASKAERAPPPYAVCLSSPDSERHAALSGRCSSCNCIDPSSCACARRLSASGSLNLNTPPAPDDTQRPPTPRPLRSRIQQTSAALWSSLCCGRPGTVPALLSAEEGAAGTSGERLHTPFAEVHATTVACNSTGSNRSHTTTASPCQHSPNSTAGSIGLELPMPPAAQPGDVAFAGAGDSDDIYDTDGGHIFAVNPLPWLEQVLSDVSPDLAQKLMHEAFKPATGLQQLQPLLAGLPARLQALTYHACTPCIDTHAEFQADIMKLEEAKFAADMIPQLSTVTAVKLRIQSRERLPRMSQELDMAQKNLLHAAFALPQLKTLHFTVYNRLLGPTEGAAIVSKLTQTSTLEDLQIRADGCTDRVQGTFLAQAVCAPPHLTRLDLRGKGLINDLSGTLAAHMPNLTALRELHIDDSSLSHNHAAALVRAVAALRDLTSLCFGGVNCSIAGQADHLNVCAEALVFTACMLTNLRSLSVCEGSLATSGWCGIGRAMEDQLECCAQLTHLALVRSVRCEDMLGVGRALTCMPHLRSLNIVTFCHDKPPLCTASVQCNVNLHPCVPAIHHLLPGLSSATMLRELALAGFIVTPHQAGLLATVLIQLSGLQSLTLSDASPSGHTWETAASTLANVMASGEHFTALRDLCVLTSKANQVLSTAISALSSLTALSFMVLHGSVTMPALAGGLWRLGGLRRLHLRIRRVSENDLLALAPALQQLSRLTKLQLQFDLFHKQLLRQVGKALVVPGPSSVSEALTLHLSKKVRGNESPGLLNLRMLDVSQCGLADDCELDMRMHLLTPAVMSLPNLEEVVVSPRLWVDGLASTWGVRVTVRTSSEIWDSANCK